MKITFEDRMKLLKAHNNLNSILTMVCECHDMYMSDIGKLEQAVGELQNMFGFEPPTDKEGNKQYYMTDWVLKDDNSKN
jgi:hypothetical protein